MFFPSLPFMGVMLFPSFVLGNASGESGASLAPLFPFFFSLPLSLLSSSSFPFFLSSPLFSLPSFLFSLNSFHHFSSSPLFHFPLSRLLFILSFSFVPFLLPSPASPPPPPPPPPFFLRELLVLNAFQDVIEDTTYCNRMQFN